MMTDQERERQIQAILDKGLVKRTGILDVTRSLWRVLLRELLILLPASLALMLLLSGIAPLLSGAFAVSVAYAFCMSVPLMFIGMTGVFVIKHYTGGQAELMMSCRYTLLHLAAIAMLAFGAVSLLCAGVVLMVFPMEYEFDVFALGSCALMAFSSLTLLLMRTLGTARGAALVPVIWLVTCALVLGLPNQLPPAWMTAPLALLMGAAYLFQIQRLLSNQRNGAKELCY